MKRKLGYIFVEFAHLIFLMVSSQLAYVGLQ